MRKAFLIAALIAVALVAGCTAPTTDDKKQEQYVTQPDKVIANLSAYKGCSTIVSEKELSDATTWSEQDTSFFTGNYGAIQMDCDYYETTSAGKYHVAFAIYPGGTEKFQTIIDSWKNLNKNTTFSSDLLVGLHTFSSKPGVLAFIDKQTGIVVWMRLSTTGTELTDSDWSNAVAIGQLVERKLN
ncbi:MAG TPA: hypothetical protein VI968_02780 [archaeon]|nr:hypothetical protein [archaeon]